VNKDYEIPTNADVGGSVIGMMEQQRIEHFSSAYRWRVFGAACTAMQNNSPAKVYRPKTRQAHSSSYLPESEQEVRARIRYRSRSAASRSADRLRSFTHSLCRNGAYKIRINSQVKR